MAQLRMNVYAIKRDDWNVKEFVLDDDDYLDHVPEDFCSYEELINFSAHNTKFSSLWKKVQADYIAPAGISNTITPDIGTWDGATLVLSPLAYEKLSAPLEKHGEMLPISIGGKTHYIFNCNELARVDEINSKYRKVDGEIADIECLAFNTVDVESKVAFKTTFDNCSVLYCTEYLRNLVLENKLSGIRFSDDFLSPF